MQQLTGLPLETELELTFANCANLIAYPSADESVVEKRINELVSLGVKSIIPYGKTVIGKTRIAGKGCVGLVVKARMSQKGENGADRICALKARRVDADRPSMLAEAALQSKANSAGIGPALVASSENFLVMDFVEGPSILEWAQNGKSRKDTLRSLALSILKQCRELDLAGIDHGELSRLDRHVIISRLGDKTIAPVIIDFESASTTRKTANVTAAAQAIFVGGGLVAKKFGGRLQVRDRSQLIAALKSYKLDKTQDSFEKLLKALDLTSYSF